MEYADWEIVGSRSTDFECTDDYVKVNSIHGTEKTELGVYCGPAAPDPQGE